MEKNQNKINMKAYSITAQGGREYQEDKFVNTQIEKGVYLSCVFDGHGGDEVSIFLQNNFPDFVKQGLHNGGRHDIPMLLRRAFRTADNMIEVINTPMTGSTAVVCYIDKEKVFFANAGDSLGMIHYSSHDHVEYMSIDHKVDNPNETKRINSNGGQILYSSGMGRVSGTLNLARSLGDFYLKQWVISDPFIRSESIKNIHYIFLASDGVWDVMDKNNIHKILKGVTHATAYNELNNIIDYALAAGSTDNITATLILLE
jgi:serine/threonine protein phosphatase PrpC